MQNNINFYDYNRFLRTKFGEKVNKISLHVGFTCPNRDGSKGTGGCIYCNNASFSPPVYKAKKQELPEQPKKDFCSVLLQETSRDEFDLDRQLQHGLEVGKRAGVHKFIAYFQAYTNTYASVSYLEKLYRRTMKYPEIVGISIGTRPDAVDEEKLAMLGEISKETFLTLEYGVQSTSNTILKWIRRGHSYEDFLQALAITQKYHIRVVCHLMFGLPGQTRENVWETSHEMNRIGIQGIKLHNLLIVKDTPLAQMYSDVPFPLLDSTEYISWVCDFIERLSPNIVCERLYATTRPEYLIAPMWPLKIAMNLAIDKELEHRSSSQGILYQKMP